MTPQIGNNFVANICINRTAQFCDIFSELWPILWPIYENFIFSGTAIGNNYIALNQGCKMAVNDNIMHLKKYI